MRPGDDNTKNRVITVVGGYRGLCGSCDDGGVSYSYGNAIDDVTTSIHAGVRRRRRLKRAIDPMLQRVVIRNPFGRRPPRLSQSPNGDFQSVFLLFSFPIHANSDYVNSGGGRVLNTLDERGKTGI